MGNQSSNSYDQISKADYTFTFQLLRKIQDPHYGEVKIVRDIKTGEQIILKEVVCTTKDAYQKEVEFYNKRVAVSHPNVVRIYGCNGQDKQNFCSSYYRISVFIELLTKTLANELETRIETGIPFSENDVLLIAENLIGGLSYFEKHDVCHGDIRPENIFVCPNAYKLSDPNLNVQKNANALSNAILGQAETLLSPQLLVQVPQSDFNVHCNKFKSDVFSLGMTLLSLASLTVSQEIYDYETGTFHVDLLQDRIELVRKSYSKFTFELIRDMLKFNEEARPDFIALSNRLTPYQEEIRLKGELPFFGIRAPYEEKQENEDEFDINKYTYQENDNPFLNDFITSQIHQTTNRKVNVSNGRPQEDYYDQNQENGDRNNRLNFDLDYENNDGDDTPQQIFEQPEGNQEANVEVSALSREQQSNLFEDGSVQSICLDDRQLRDDYRRNSQVPMSTQPGLMQYVDPNVHDSRPQARMNQQAQFNSQSQHEPQIRSYPALPGQSYFETNQQQQQQQQQQQYYQNQAQVTPQQMYADPRRGMQRQVSNPNQSQVDSSRGYQNQAALISQTNVGPQRIIQNQLPTQQASFNQIQRMPSASETYHQQQQVQLQNNQTWAIPQAYLEVKKSHSTPAEQQFQTVQGQSQAQYQPQVQPQVQIQANAEQKLGTADLDDLEAKIKAALDRSEATYRRAYRPNYLPSPNKNSNIQTDIPASNTKSYPEASTTYASQSIYQTPSYKVGDNSELYYNQVSSGVAGYERPFEAENSKASYDHTKLGNNYAGLSNPVAKNLLTSDVSRQQSDVLPTNAASAENTFYETSPGYLSHVSPTVYSSGPSYGNQPYYSQQYNQVDGLANGYSTSYNTGVGGYGNTGGYYRNDIDTGSVSLKGSRVLDRPGQPMEFGGAKKSLMQNMIYN